METKKKTRNLSVAEYFLVIQKEYLIAEFRKKIYFSKNDKNYYQRVMNGKREKIEMILQDIQFYGSYKEKFPGKIGRIFNIGSYHMGFSSFFICLLLLGMLCLTGLLLIVVLTLIVG